jgi:hypothetical protein
VCSAGLNGMAHVYVLAQTGQHILMELNGDNWRHSATTIYHIIS